MIHVCRARQTRQKKQPLSSQIKIIQPMKKSLYISILMIAGIFHSSFSQITWSQLPLTGSEAKIFPAARQPRFNISLIFSFPTGDIGPQNIAMPALQNAAYAPETAVQLFEKLGGEFMIGNTSGPQKQTVALPGRMQTSPGLQAGARIGSRFEVRVNAQHFRSEWSGVFPVVILPFQEEHPLPPKTTEGSISTSSSGFMVNLETAFFVTRGNVRPYVAGGVSGLFPVQAQSEAEIAGVSLPLNIERAESSFSPLGAVGLRWIFWKNAFLDAGCSYGKLPDGEYHPMARAGAGWAF